MFIARVARLGFLANFLSRTVLIGFLTGVGIQVAMGQVGGMFDVPAQKVSTTAFAGTIRKFALTLAHIGEGSWQTALVSLSVLAILIVFGRWIKAVPGGLVAVVGMIGLSYAFDFASHSISTLGPVPSGLPHLGLPQHVTWNDVGLLMATSISMFLVILAQSAATSRAYAVKYNEDFEENTDLVGLGLANLAAGLSSTFVVNGSPTKTEMADDAKSHTQVAQLTTAAVVAIVLLFLTKPLQYLPNCVLSSVVFLIGLKLIDIHGMKEVYRLSREEFWVAALTALVVVAVGVEQGIILALLLSLVLHVRRHYTTVDVVITRDAKGHVAPVPVTPGARTVPGLVIYRFGAGIFYANATRLSDEVLAIAGSDDPPRWIVLDAAPIDDIDYTGGKTLSELADQLKERNIVLAVCNVEKRVQSELDRYEITSKIGSEHVYETVEDAIDAFRGAGSGG